MAVIEAIPVLFMMVLLFNFSLGFFGAIHSGILNSIGAYNYSMETFRYRSNLMYFRPGGDKINYKISGNRVHGIGADGTESGANDNKENWPATMRDITFNRKLAGQASDRNYAGRTSQTNIWFATSMFSPNTGSDIKTPKIWVKTVYGICVTADCCTDGNCERSGE